MTGTSLIATMAARYQMDPKKFEQAVRKTAMTSSHTEEEFAVYLMAAHHYGLSPLLREIYAYPKKGGGIQVVVSIDGWINLVNSHPQANGFEVTFNEDDGKLVSATCTMWRKDREHPTVVTEYLSEVYRNTDPWNAMPRRMLRHKAFKECARLAFGFSVTDEDEARDIGRTIDHIEAPIAPPTSTIDALDHFASDPAAPPPSVQAGSDIDGAGYPASTVEEAAGAVPHSAPAALYQMAIDKILGAATDKQLPDREDRIANLDGPVREIWEAQKALPHAFVQYALQTGVQVVDGDLTEKQARKLLEARVP